MFLCMHLKVKFKTLTCCPKLDPTLQFQTNLEKDFSTSTTKRGRDNLCDSIALVFTGLYSANSKACQCQALNLNFTRLGELN